MEKNMFTNSVKNCEVRKNKIFIGKERERMKEKGKEKVYFLHNKEEMKERCPVNKISIEMFHFIESDSKTGFRVLFPFRVFT